MGEKLTPRQFQLLYKARVEDGNQVKYIRDNESNTFLDSRDMVRILEEQRESARRRMVMQGTCTEDQSESKMQEMIAKAA